MTGRIVRHGKRSALPALTLIGFALSVPLSVPAWAAAPTPNIDLGIGLKHGLNGVADDRGVRAGIKLRW